MDMEKKSPLRDVMNSTMEKVREMVDANNIVGAPITTPDGVTLIPISRVSFGFGSGFGGSLRGTFLVGEFDVVFLFDLDFNGLVGLVGFSALVDIGSHGFLAFSCSRLGLRVFGRCLVLKHAIEIVRAPVVVFACLALAVAAGFVVFLPLFGHERIVFLLQLIVFGVRMLRRCRLGRLIALVLLGLLVFGRDNLPRGVFRHATAQASCFPENTHV